MLLTRAPLAGGGGRSLLPAAARLACVKPAASVHPEPGSNSPLLVYIVSYFLLLVESPEGDSVCLDLGYPSVRRSRNRFPGLTEIGIFRVSLYLVCMAETQI